MLLLFCARRSWFLLAGSSLVVCAVASISGGATKTESPAPSSARSDLMVTDELRETRFGTIKGSLVWGGPTVPILLPLVAVGKAQRDPNICAATRAIPNRQLVVDPVTKGIEYGIAYVNQPKGRNLEAEKERVAEVPKVVIDQKNCEFIPYVTVIHQDQVVMFRSSDPVNHNLHISPFTNPGFNLMIAANGTIQKKFVAEKIIIPLTCDLHPWMTAHIKVLDHPYFAVTSKEGSFEIWGVPVGEQRLVLWHPSAGFVLKERGEGVLINVEAGKTTDVGQITLDPSRSRIEPSKFQVAP
jgi:hypothetical protein